MVLIILLCLILARSNIKLKIGGALASASALQGWTTFSLGFRRGLSPRLTCTSAEPPPDLLTPRHSKCFTLVFLSPCAQQPTSAVSTRPTLLHLLLVLLFLCLISLAERKNQHRTYKKKRKRDFSKAWSPAGPQLGGSVIQSWQN